MAEEEDLYDEFGNYIGPELDDSSDEESEGEPRAIPDDTSDVSDEDDDNNRSSEQRQQPDEIVRDGSGGGAIVMRQEGADEDVEMADPSSAIVLHEDKVHYPSAQEVYGDDVRTAVLDEDAMDIEVPIVEPVQTKSNRATLSGEQEKYVYSDEYLSALFGNETTRTRRGIALVGHLHSGKTSFVDMLLEKTLISKIQQEGFFGSKAATSAFPRYTDLLEAEQARGLSISSTPLTTILPDTRGKSYLLTMMDCPGHVNFHDESVAALRAFDGAVVVLDAAEGILMHTEMVVKQAISEGLPLLLLINKMDRLIIDLKLPPKDCYFKLLNLVETMNVLVKQASNGRYPKFSPAKGNVTFASAQHGWCFTLESFAQLYLDHMDDEHALGENLSVQDFSQRLWGDIYLDEETREFRKGRGGDERTFVRYVLNPVYKLYAACLGEREQEVSKLLRRVGVLLSKEQLRASSRVLLRCALSKFFETALSGFVDMVVKFVPSPSTAARGKILRCYTGLQDSELVDAMVRCDSSGPLMIHCVKMYPSADGQSFSVFGRVYSGIVQPGDRVRVLGEGYSPEVDEEDVAVANIEAVSIPRGRTRTQVSKATAGNWVLLDGVDSNISKTATITTEQGVANDNEVHIFSPLKFPLAGGESTMKLAIEPLKPAELPKMVEGLRRISKAYPMASTRVEESGEHVLFGTGELYMDCMMHDLRNVYSEIEVKVADPLVGFRETVIETSSVKCFSETTNKRNKLTFVAEPIDDGLAERLEKGEVKVTWDKKKMGRFFQTKYDWDLLSSRSVWAFGASATHGTNILLDDTLPSEVDKSLLKTCKSSIIQGFQWATREGPLCEEPVRATKIKILDTVLADKPIHRGGGQIIPTARRTVHSSILTATPKLLEPVYRLQIQCPLDIVDVIQPVLTKRRGHIVQSKPIPGSLLCTIRGYLPVLDSFGFETDLRTFSQGQAMVHSVFDHWAIVPGDPLDKSIVLHPLEPSPPQHLARELLVKTRRRKGLSEDVSINKFFDESMKQLLTEDPRIAEFNE